MLWISTPSWPSSTAAREWTQIDWEQRQQLRGKPLALVVARLLCQPRRALPAERRAYLHKLSGSQTKRLRSISKQNLTQALRDLEAVGAIKSFEIRRTTLVHVRTVPSQSQQKHLAARRPLGRRRK